jgi:DNA polymerase-4
VQGSGLGRVTVRFERPGSPPGRVRTFAQDDPLLRRSDPLPLVPQDAPGGVSRSQSPSVPGPPDEPGTSRP